MTSKFTHFACMILLAALSGCPLSSIRDQNPPALYLLDADTGSLSATATKPETLIVSETTSARYLNSQKIAFKNSANTISYYKLALWAEPPPARFTSLLLSALEKSRLFRQVTRSSATSVADFLLACEILEFLHDATTSPGNAHATVRCEVTRLRDRAALVSNQFSETADLTSYDAAGAVDGMKRVTSKLLANILDWLSQESAKNFSQS